MTHGQKHILSKCHSAAGFSSKCTHYIYRLPGNVKSVLKPNEMPLKLSAVGLLDVHLSWHVSKCCEKG